MILARLEGDPEIGQNEGGSEFGNLFDDRCMRREALGAVSVEPMGGSRGVTSS